MKMLNAQQLLAFAIFVSVPVMVTAQSNQTAVAEPDLLDVTCADYRAALRAADPGKNPKAAAKATALNAQDDIVNGLMWVHGYLSARAGPSAAMSPLTKSWMVATVGKLANACDAHSPDGKMRLTDAAGKL